ncbi:DUF3606 domain-containing protein [Variovorax sp. tm]|jgi:hypothetical protein|uniref:DUF3606 domain-containing protein n=1 Tax=Variovorax atrisoli TaxID=3394203 RepID=UPI002787FB0E|nr:hypothetical protein [Variovorax paradoxus]
MAMIHRFKTQNISAATSADAKAWARKLECSVAELRIALRAVGGSAERVKAYLDALKERAQLPGAERGTPSQQKPGEPAQMPTLLPVWPIPPGPDKVRTPKQ